MLWFHMAAAEYDIFLSHAWADGERPQQLAEALIQAGLRVWIDAKEIKDFSSITQAVTTKLAQSKALLAYYSKTYPLRRACQWELTAAFLAAQSDGGNPQDRVLVINPEQSDDHIHPIELRDEKFLRVPSNDGEMQKLVDSVVKHVGTLDGPLPDIHSLDPPPWHGIKPVRYEEFVGRFQEMWRIHSALQETRVVQITGTSGQDVAQVTGLGGIGKSLLAKEYALRFGSAYPGGVFWLNAYGNDDAKAALGATEREALRADQVRGLAERLGIDAHGKTGEEIEGALARKIAGEGKDCLWVVDDVPNGLDEEALRRWFAPHALARTLITARSRTYGNLDSARTISLEVLPEGDAYQLLTSRRKPASKDEEEQAGGLANDLGYHALALDVTASALMFSVAAKPFGDFRAKLAGPDKDALELAKDLADALPTGHERSIAQTMLRSIRGLGAEGLDFLRLASELAVAPIPASLVMAVFEEADKLSHEEAGWRASLALKQVAAASLAEITDEQQNARSVHTLVSRTVRFQERVSPERTQAMRGAAVEALGVALAKAAKDPRLHKQIEFHVTHARQVVTVVESVPEANLSSWVARYDQVRGRYTSARKLYEHELDFRRREQGPEHPYTLDSMANLAGMLYAQGDLARARKLQEEALEISRRVLGRGHPRTISMVNNLAEILKARGELAGARKLQEETLAMLMPDHPLTIISMGNLASTLWAQGDLAGARKLQETVLGVHLRILGPDDLNTLVSMRNLANTLSAQGELRRARKLQKEILQRRRRILGAEHPQATNSAFDLFQTLTKLGERSAAGVVLDRDLRWLLDRNADTLGADQRKTRNDVWAAANSYRPLGKRASFWKRILRREQEDF